jgi:hypothetical protein
VRAGSWQRDRLARWREQPLQPFGKRSGPLGAGEARPLDLAKTIGDPRRRLGGRVDRDRHEKGLVFRHQVRAIDGELPFEPEVTLGSRVRVGGNQRHEQRAVPDALADRSIPRVTAAQLVLIEPDLDTRGLQRIAYAAGCLLVLRRVA